MKAEQESTYLSTIAAQEGEIGSLRAQVSVLREALSRIANDKQHFEFREKWKLSMTEMAIIESFQKEAREALAATDKHFYSGLTLNWPKDPQCTGVDGS